MELAYCGLRCDLCPVYIATKTDNQLLREDIARKWSKKNYQLTSDDINCLGCNKDNKVVFKFCRECMVRSCSVSKNFETCGECNNYPCVELAKPFNIDHGNKTRLDIIHKKKYPIK